MNVSIHLRDPKKFQALLIIFMAKQLEALKKFLDKKFFIMLAGYFSLALVFAFLAKWLVNFKWLIKSDVAVQKIILDTRIDFLNDFFKIFTDLGDTKIMAILAIVAAIIFSAKKYYWHSIGILLSVGIAEIVSLVLKNLIGRHRPPHDLALVATDSASFPSGHTIAAIAFYGFLIYFLGKEIKNKQAKNILMAFCAAMILLAGFARIYLGAHWPSDVLASYILGGIWLWIIIRLIEKNKATLEN